MAKYGRDERQLFNVSSIASENLSGTPSDADSGQMLSYIKGDHLYIKKPSVSEVLMPENAGNASAVTGLSLFKQKNSAGILEFYGIKSADGHLDIAMNGDDIELTVDLSDINDELDHGLLQGRGDDDHVQYFLLAGRSGGQIAEGGTDASDDLELKSTDNATKGQVKIIDGSSFQHSSRFMQEYDLQTTDAVEGSLVDIPLDDDKVSSFKVTVVCRRSDGGAEGRASWEFQTTAYRAGAGATLQGSVKQAYKSSSIGALKADMDVNTNNVRVRVTGIALQDFEWKAYVRQLVSD